MKSSLHAKFTLVPVILHMSPGACVEVFLKLRGPCEQTIPYSSRWLVDRASGNVLLRDDGVGRRRDGKY